MLTLEQEPYLHPFRGLHCLHFGPDHPVLRFGNLFFFCLKILDLADVYLHRHSPGALQVPWLGRQPSAQTGEEQKIPFHPSWKKEQHQHFNIILWAFQPCRCTGTVVDRCHGHNQAAEHNPDSKVLSQIILMISSISAVYYITYYIMYSIYDIYHTILYDI